MKRALAAVLVCVGLVAGTAGAASAGGATPTRDVLQLTGCSGDETFSVCTNAKIVTKVISMDAGTSLVQVRILGTVVLTEGETTATSTLKQSQMLITREGQATFFRTKITLTSGGVIGECTFSGMIIVVKGVARVDQADFSCVEPTPPV